MTRQRPWKRWPPQKPGLRCNPRSASGQSSRPTGSRRSRAPESFRAARREFLDGLAELVRGQFGLPLKVAVAYIPPVAHHARGVLLMADWAPRIPHGKSATWTGMTPPEMLRLPIISPATETVKALHSASSCVHINGRPTAWASALSDHVPFGTGRRCPRWCLGLFGWAGVSTVKSSASR
jgi:hypothetical protein